MGVRSFVREPSKVGCRGGRGQVVGENSETANMLKQLGMLLDEAIWLGEERGGRHRSAISGLHSRPVSCRSSCIHAAVLGGIPCGLPNGAGQASAAVSAERTRRLQYGHLAQCELPGQ